MMIKSEAYKLQAARIEAVARLLREFDGEYSVELQEYFADAARALTLADEADRNAGVIRVVGRRRLSWRRLTKDAGAQP